MAFDQYDCVILNFKKLHYKNTFKKSNNNLSDVDS